MAVAVKDAASAAQKYVTRAQAAGTDYSNGVSNAGAKWAQMTKSAAGSWSQGVAAAAADGRFANGINQNSQNKYQTRASQVGAQRYPQGVATAGPTWQSAVQPYLTTIANLNLPARQAKGNPANYQRVQTIGDALRAKKLQATS